VQGVCKVCDAQQELCGVQEQVKSLCKMHLVCALQQEVWHLHEALLKVWDVQEALLQVLHLQQACLWCYDHKHQAATRYPSHQAPSR